MLKKVGVLGVLTVVAVGFLSAQKTPPDAPRQRVGESSGSQNGSPQPNAQDAQQAAPNPVAAAPQPPTPPCDETCQQGRQNLAIQGKLEWFTGVLAVVGILQFATMAWQGYLLRKTRGDVHAQADTMEQQAKDARESSAAASFIAQETLAALKRQADAMDKQNRTMQNRERARLTIIDPPDDPLFPKWDTGLFPTTTPLQLFIGIINDGPTWAFNVRATGGMTITEIDKPSYSVGSDLVIEEMIRNASMDNPTRFAVTGGGISTYTMVDNNLVDDIRRGRAFLGMSGRITYEDVAGEPHQTPFHFVWTVFGNDAGGAWLTESFWATRSPPST